MSQNEEFCWIERSARVDDLNMLNHEKLIFVIMTGISEIFFENSYYDKLFNLYLLVCIKS